MTHENDALAGAAEAAPLHAVTPADATLTRTGVAMGTAGYMSPEQVRGEKLDARTDIFSFGLVLYEMATGQRAFTGETAAVVHDAILHKPPVPVRQLNSTLPAKLVTTIEKALEKDREQRFQTAAELRGEELCKFARNDSRQAPPCPTAGRSAGGADGSRRSCLVRVAAAGTIVEAGGATDHVQRSGKPRNLRRDFSGWQVYGLPRPDGPLSAQYRLR
jgi:serine/threonine protein kinase